jgi:hypothetical protein
VLIAVAVVGLRPWAPASLVPSVAISPGLSGGVDDSVALPPTQGGAGSVADASVARQATPKLAAEHAVDAGRAGHDEHGTGTGAALAVSRAEQVASVGRGSGPTQPAEPSPAPEAQPVSAPAPEPPSAPAAAPVPAVVGESGSRPPVAAGGGGIGKEPVCDGDEYVLVITPEGEEGPDVAPLFAIRIEYFGSDGSESEYSLQGDQTDVDELVELLGADGSCVRVEEEPVDEAVEPVAEEPEAGTEAAGLGETLESELP